MKYLISLIIVSCVGLVSCDKDKKPETLLTKSQEKALDSAKDINDSILNAHDERRKKLEEETQ